MRSGPPFGLETVVTAGQDDVVFGAQRQDRHAVGAQWLEFACVGPLVTIQVTPEHKLAPPRVVFGYSPVAVVVELRQRHVLTRNALTWTASGVFASNVRVLSQLTGISRCPRTPALA